MSTGRQYPRRSRGRRQDSLQAPGSLADERQIHELVIMALERAGHGLELGCILRQEKTGFDGSPFRRLHASQSGCFFQGQALGITNLLDTAAEKLGIDLLAGGSEGGLLAK